MSAVMPSFVGSFGRATGMGSALSAAMGPASGLAPAAPSPKPGVMFPDEPSGATLSGSLGRIGVPVGYKQKSPSSKATVLGSIGR